MSQLDGQPTGSSGPTGDLQVDAVLGSLGTLSARPVDEHVAIFETAHAALRAALDNRDGDATAPPAPA